MRNTFIFKLVLTLCMANLIGLFSPQVEAEILKLTLGGRGISGPYFPTAGTIASSVNRKYSQHGVRIMVKSRRSSVSNIKAVMSGEFEFGVARMSHIYQAYKGLAKWEGSPQTELRSVLNVHAEQVTLVALAKSGIKTIQDLKDRRVFMGGPDSDLRYTVMDILTASGINPKSDLTATGTVTEDAPGMMHNNEIDAFFYIMGIMNRAFIDLVSGTQEICLVPITGLGIDQMVVTNPFYEKSTVEIRHHPYFKNESNVQVLGVKAGMITSTRIAEKTTYIVVREIFKNIDEFKNRHSATSILTPQEMTTDMVAPVHQGVAKFYQQSAIGYNVTIP